MKRAQILRITAAMATLALAALPGCTMKDQEAPPLTGPSELALSIGVAASPDILTLDGASQSLVTVTARDANAAPLRNVSLRAETYINGIRADYGALSARNIVTGNDGRATFVYTAPFSNSPVDNGTVVDVTVTPVGTDFNNSSGPRIASIRLVPQGIVIPPDGLRPSFTIVPLSPTVGQTALFDASASQGSIVDYQWNFGDGGRATGRNATHSYATAGSYAVTLTVVDGFGRSASTVQSVTVGAGAQPVAQFVFSPTNPRVSQGINFNASASTAPGGARVVSYRWDFGDGSPLVTTGEPITNHSYELPRTYTVTLVVTDSVGRTQANSQTVTVIP